MLRGFLIRVFIDPDDPIRRQQDKRLEEAFQNVQKARREARMRAKLLRAERRRVDRQVIALAELIQGLREMNSDDRD